MFFSHSATAWSVIHCLTFKVLHSFDSQFQGGVFIAHKNGLWVLLKGRHCPHVIHTFLYGFVQSKRLVCSGDENHNLRTDWKPRNNSASSEVNWWPLFLIFRHSSKSTNTVADTEWDSQPLWHPWQCPLPPSAPWWGLLRDLHQRIGHWPWWCPSPAFSPWSWIPDLNQAH